MENRDRADAFQKNREVERILDLLDTHLSPIEDTLTAGVDTSKYPTVFIFGCARSGTTLLHQYMIRNTECIFPSNFISRFYYAPFLGGLYYKLFTDLDNRGELLGDVSGGKKDYFSSDLGKTTGVHSPNEFWYFWRKHFPTNDRGTVDIDRVREDEANRFRSSVFALQNLFEGPFITKGMIANNYIDFLEKLFPRSIFIFIKRDLYANAKSLYQARIEFFDDPKIWYSFYPDEPGAYDHLSAEEQVVHQVIDTNKEIARSLGRCDGSRTVEIDYASFCNSPDRVLTMLQNIDNTIRIVEKPRPSSFAVRERQGLNRDADQKIKTAIDKIT